MANIGKIGEGAATFEQGYKAEGCKPEEVSTASRANHFGKLSHFVLPCGYNKKLSRSEALGGCQG
ncbi:hypothetical protein Apmu_0168_11 [Acidiphilium multivorum AIU301]|nr:hypothetical protein Apmu_0168_11 [Acidiphilium multivorum AIU301]